MSTIMNLNIFLVIIALVVLSLGALYLNLTNVVDNSLTAVAAFLLVLVGGAFFFILKLSSIFQAHKEMKDTFFQEIKEAIETNHITFDPGVIRRINLLVKLKSDAGEGYYIAVNDDLKTLYYVTVVGLHVMVSKSTIHFFQESFMDEQDLVNYINNSTKWSVENYALIVDGLQD